MAVSADSVALVVAGCSGSVAAEWAAVAAG